VSRTPNGKNERLVTQGTAPGPESSIELSQELSEYLTETRAAPQKAVDRIRKTKVECISSTSGAPPVKKRHLNEDDSFPPTLFNYLPASSPLPSSLSDSPGPLYPRRSIHMTWSLSPSYMHQSIHRGRSPSPTMIDVMRIYNWWTPSPPPPAIPSKPMSSQTASGSLIAAFRAWDRGDTERVAVPNFIHCYSCDFLMERDLYSIHTCELK